MKKQKAMDGPDRPPPASPPHFFAITHRHAVPHSITPLPRSSPSPSFPLTYIENKQQSEDMDSDKDGAPPGEEGVEDFSKGPLSVLWHSVKVR